MAWVGLLQLKHVLLPHVLKILTFGGFVLIDLFAFLACCPHKTKPYVQQFVHYLYLFYSLKTIQ
jgi:hypothetical protein